VDADDELASVEQTARQSGRPGAACRRDIWCALPARSGWPEVRLDVRCSMLGTVAVVSVTGEVDMSTGSRLREAIGDQLAAGHGRLVLDLTGVTFLDSTALGILVGTRKKIAESGGEMRVACADPRMLRLLTVTGLTRTIAVHPTVAEAVSDWPEAGS
jgi:anti-sigma B factor antagonist